MHYTTADQRPSGRQTMTPPTVQVEESQKISPQAKEMSRRMRNEITRSGIKFHAFYPSTSSANISNDRPVTS